MKKGIVSILMIVISATAAFAQNGFLRGQVIDGSSGEPLFGATVVKQGTTLGAITDFDGNFSLSLEEGTHTISVQFVSYRTVTVEGVEIIADEVTTLDVTIEEDVQQLEAVVVTAEQIRDNEVALLAVQRKSANTLDGISSASFKKIGDTNLSSAMKRVTGVTVQGGKYVYVRGLGDRYTKAAVNGMVVPGLDPDRNDVQIDIFPTAVLENVVVYKTFSPDLSGDFAGGLVDIQTKSFPTEKSTSFSISAGYNPSMHFKSNNLSYTGSGTDVFGWDGGIRTKPLADGTTIPATPNDFVADATRKFNSQLGTVESMNFMDMGMSFTHRNQIQGEKLTFGYNAIFNYKSFNTFYDDFQRNRYERDRTTGEITLERDFSSSGRLSTNNVLWSALGTFAVKTDNHSVGLNLLHSQNGESNSMFRVMKFSQLNNPTTIHNDILAYTERSMTNGILFGKHSFGKLRWEWSNSLIYSKIEDPDYRDTRINEDNDSYGFRNGGTIARFWRSLNQWTETAKTDLTYELNENNKLKAGGSFSYSDRDFGLDYYTYAVLQSFNVEENDANWLLQEQNLWSSTNTDGLYIQDGSTDFNQYSANQSIYAAYVMNEMQITEKLKSVYGLRFEKAQMFYTGVRLLEDNSRQNENNTKTLDENSFLPSVNLIYALRDDMNLRASYNQTLARPSFKEKSSAFIADPITDVTFSGNLDLRQAQIRNYDVRWEYFMTPSEMFSVSFFYKDFTDHIALVFFPNVVGQIKPRNVGSAQVYGTELEARKNLDFISPSLRDFSVGSNVSLVVSKVDRTTVEVSEDGLSEYQSEVNYRGTETGVARYREMSGQAPYVINGFVNYENQELGITANASYNVQGETISLIGTSNVPDVYNKPFHSLNLKIAKQLGEHSNLSVSAKNILGDERERVYKFEGEEKIFSLFNPGTAFSVKYVYSF